MPVDWGMVMSIVVVIIGIVLIIGIGFLSLWKKVPQDRAGVVTGMKKRVISGGGGLVVPLLERIDYISLENMQVLAEVVALTSSGVQVSIGALTVLKIKNTQDGVLAAMEQFNVGHLDKTIVNIKGTTEEVLEGKLREIMSSMTVEELYKDREKFASKVQEVATADLTGMGLEIKTFTIKDISDSQGYIHALGKERTAAVKRDAAIAEARAKAEQETAVAESERNAAIEVAKRRQEREEAEAQAAVKIADAQREKELRTQENRKKTEAQRAIADSAYEIESNRTKQEVVESQLAIEVARETKQIEVVEAQSAVKMKEEKHETEIAEQRAARTAKELESQVQKRAEAAAAKTQIDAEAELFKRQKDAEAQKYEEITKSDADAAKKERQALADAIVKERQAQADAEVVTRKAEADAAAILKIAEVEAAAVKAKGFANADAEAAVGKAKAEAIRAQGLAEAEVIRQKALAEAEGKLQLAEAFKQYGDAAMSQMFIEVLPNVARPVAEAVSSAIAQVGGITIIDNGGGASGASKLTNIATGLLTEVPAAVKAITGIDMTAMMQNFASKASGSTMVRAMPSVKRIAEMSYEEILNSPVDDLLGKCGGLQAFTNSEPDLDTSLSLRSLFQANAGLLEKSLIFLTAKREDAEVQRVIEAIGTII